MGAYLGSSQKLKLKINQVTYKIRTGKRSVCAHEYSPIETVSPTCMTQGYTKYMCSLCGNTYNGDYTDKLEHESASRTEYKIEATCTSEGSYDSVKYCTVCKEVLSRTHITIPITDHDWSEWIVDEDNKIKYRECKNCDESQTEEIESSHTCTPGTPVIENEVSADCVTDGSYDKVTYCTECNEEISRETIEIEATGHNWGELEIDVPATETTQGSGHRDCLNNCG